MTMDQEGSNRSQDLVVLPSNQRAWLLLLGSLVMILGSALLLFLGLTSSEIFQTIIGLLGLAFFSLGGAYILYRYVSQTPLLVVDDVGIIENASLIGVGRVYWFEIEEFIAYSTSGRRMLAIILKDQDIVLRRLSWPKRLLWSLNHFLGVVPLNIPQTMLSIRIEELLLELEKRMK